MAKKPPQNTKPVAPPQPAAASNGNTVEGITIMPALNGSNALPSMISLGENRPDVSLGDVVARAHQDSGLSVEDWNALPEDERDAKLVAVIEALQADPRTAGDGDANAASDGDSESSSGAAQDVGQEPEGGWCYPVLTPTKFRGVLVKPPALIQLTAQEAAPYLAANLVGDDVTFPPTAD